MIVSRTFPSSLALGDLSSAGQGNARAMRHAARHIPIAALILIVMVLILLPGDVHPSSGMMHAVPLCAAPVWNSSIHNVSGAGPLNGAIPKPEPSSMPD